VIYFQNAGEGLGAA